MAKPKILFVLQLPPPVHGASMVNQSIKDSQFINEEMDCDYISLTTAKDVSDIGKNSFKKYFKSVHIYYTTIKQTLSQKYDFVYLTLSPHGIAFYKDAFLAILLKLLGSKLIFHLHGKGIKKIVDNSTIKRQFYKFVFKNVSVIHLSPILYKDIKLIVKEDNVWFVPNGITATPNALKHRGNNNRVLYLSNMQETKGSFTLLEAAKILKDKGCAFHIDFVGKWHSNSDYKEKWERFYQNNDLSDVVTYHGPKYNEEKNALFQTASCFVLPTFYKNECFPISILEAMSHGLPVISTNEGAINEIINDGENGFLINKNSPDELANKIALILNDGTLADQLGSKALSKFKEHYRIEVFETNFCKTISEIYAAKIKS